MKDEPCAVTLPATVADMADLSAGDSVRLFGVAFTARDATHARLIAEARESGRLPYGLEGQTLFYAGPTPARAGRPAGAIGPTTASRMDPWTPDLLALGVTATIGKGARSPLVARACAEHGAVYFAAVGGAAALLATHVTKMEPVAYPELGAEALVRVTLDGLPAVVAIDPMGADLFESAPKAWRKQGDPDA
jgi:tartrate/fumarate subfamily iron-sulfur-dependent hydro-lyase beta chain